MTDVSGIGTLHACDVELGHELQIMDLSIASMHHVYCIDP